MNTSKVKSIMFLIGIVAFLLSPLKTNAQYDENRFGIQPWFSTSLMGRESNNVSDETVFLNNQAFGQNVPLGSGLLILFGAAAGYAIIKKKED